VQGHFNGVYNRDTWTNVRYGVGAVSNLMQMAALWQTIQEIFPSCRFSIRKEVSHRAGL
jgi:hypothetical protein